MPEPQPTSEERLVADRIEKLLAAHDPATADESTFWGAQYDLGLAWVQFPEGLGGLGVRPGLQEVVSRALAAAGAPSNFSRNGIGVGMAAPVINAFASQDLKDRLLRPLYTCEEIWCQMFSEPGAGSDVAGLSTQAVRDGDEWVVNGQKVWTTLAHLSRWGLLVARTDPGVPKHNGLTYFIVDMHTPGVEVRPLRQMTGDAEFNEVYFTDARVPESMRLGEIGEGWRVAVATLMNERSAIGGNAAPTRGGGAISRAVDLCQKTGDADAATSDRVVQLWVEAELVRLTTVRAQQKRAAGTPGPEESIGKLASSELAKKVNELCVDLLGPEGLLYPTYEMVRPTLIGEGSEDLTKSFLRSRANTIEGGTSEIMRNILGERVLGLPGDVRVDKDVPWSKVSRS
jgi:alkylation response protein AidB-like acyl-CoA dehydrogenase